MTHVDLCCGLGGWQAPFRESSRWRSVGIDVRRDLEPDVVADVRSLPLRACEPDLVTASPPCTEFSTAWNGVTPLHDRDPDLSIWQGCEAAIEHLNPKWWVIENVIGAQHWFGKYDKICFPWCLWGHFPPFDVEELPGKGATWKQRPEETAEIPYPLADALRHAVETWA